MTQKIKIWILRLLRKSGILQHLDLNLSLTLNERSFVVPVIHEIGINNHCMDEWWMLDLFRIFECGHSPMLVDLGANVGQTLLKWKSVYPTGKYLGVEPNLSCINYLDHLVKRNKMKGVTTVTYAVGGRQSRAALNYFYRDRTDRSASLYQGSKDPVYYEEVNVVTLNALLKSHDIAWPDISVLKIDIEGAEIEVLETIMGLLRNEHPIIITEILEATTDEKYQTQVYLSEEMQNLGYSLYRVLKKPDYHLSSLEKISQFPRHYTVAESDYIFLHESAEKKIPIKKSTP